MMRLRTIENSKNKIDVHHGVSSLVAKNHVIASISAP